MNLDPVKTIITDIEQEVSLIKTTLESITLHGNSFSPMVVFYLNKDERSLLVVPHVTEDTFIGRMEVIADAMHLFTPLNAHACVVAFTARVELDGSMYELLNLFALSDSHAYNIRIPFQIDNDQLITWFPQFDECVGVDEIELDDMGRDMVSMLYHYTHMEHNGFSPQEIMSYLACNGAAIHQLTTKYEYFEYSEDQNESPHTNQLKEA